MKSPVMLTPKGVLLLPPNGNAGIIRSTHGAESFCWRVGWICRYESLWSLLHKFALLNAVGSIGIGESLGVELRGSNNLRYRNRADLRYFNAFDPAKLAIIFRTDEERIKEGVLLAYLKQQEVEVLGSDCLRFCASCLREGFHSAIYQLLIFNKCPLHHEDLTANCPNCRSEIPYKFSTIAFKKPYSCSKCQFLLSEAVVVENKKLAQPKIREEILGAVSDWLKKRLRLQIASRPLSKSSDLQNSTFKEQWKTFEQDKSRLITYWIDVFAVRAKFNEMLFEKCAQKDIHSLVNFRAIVKKREINDSRIIERQNLLNKEWNRELSAIYKTIRRHFIKTQLREHRKCVWKYSRESLWNKDDSLRKGRICKSANAYLLWRMSIEGVKHPLALIRRYRTPAILDAYLHWDAPDNFLSSALLKRIFALDCYWLFYECKLLADIFHTHHIYSFNTRYVTCRSTPYWMAVKSNQKKENFI